MSELTFFASAAEVQIGVRFPSEPGGGNAWDHVATTFLDIALGGRGAWIATVADPWNLHWAEVLASNTGGKQHLTRICNGRPTEFGYVERFDTRVARAIIGSTDFQWDGVFVFPRDLDDLDDVISTLDNLDVRSEPQPGSGEFVHPFGDGTGLRWVHPPPFNDMERLKNAASENGFRLLSIAEADRT